MKPFYEVHQKEPLVTVLKRKIEPSISTNSDHEDKKTKILPSFPMLDMEEDVKRKLFHIIKMLSQCVFAIPFLNLSDGQQQKWRPQSFKEVVQKIRRNDYKSSNEVFDDLLNIMTKPIVEDKRVGIKDNNGMDILYFICTKEEIDLMGKKMIEKLTVIIKEQFTEEDIYGFMKKEKGEIKERDPLAKFRESDTDKVFEALTKKFPYVPPVTVMTKALEVCLSKKAEWSLIIKDLAETNTKVASKSQKGYTTYTFNPSLSHNFDQEKVVHFYIAGYQFHRMITRWSNAPIPLRHVPNPSDAIESIIYIENNQLSDNYQATKERYLREGKVDERGKVRENLLFHGTSISSVENILKTNFIVESMPQGQRSRKKQMMFGKGVYFSELPAISLMYGNGLLLCKVLPGNCESFKPQGTVPPEIPEEFDSRDVQSRDNLGVINVIKSPDQVLPYCIIRLKKEALTSQFTKPNSANLLINGTTSKVQQATQNVQPQRILSPNLCNMTSTPTPKADQNSKMPAHPVNQVFPAYQYSVNKEAMARSTIKSNTTPAAPASSSCICTICQDMLQGSEVLSLNKCSHQFHTECLESMILSQEGQEHISCPLCFTLHGTRMGNMPVFGSKMLWWKVPEQNLSGFGKYGTIVIKYCMENGLQGEGHPNPGQPFKSLGFPRHAFLPDNDQGQGVLQMLVIAFQRGLTFRVGSSLTRGPGAGDCLVWGGIHHKTSAQPGAVHGYPDPGYLDRVTMELADKGITPTRPSLQRPKSWTETENRRDDQPLVGNIVNRQICSVQG